MASDLQKEQLQSLATHLHHLANEHQGPCHSKRNTSKRMKRLRPHHWRSHVPLYPYKQPAASAEVADSADRLGKSGAEAGPPFFGSWGVPWLNTRRPCSLSHCHANLFPPCAIHFIDTGSQLLPVIQTQRCTEFARTPLPTDRYLSLETLFTPCHKSKLASDMTSVTSSAGFGAEASF